MNPSLTPLYIAFALGLVIGAFLMLFTCACAQRRTAQRLALENIELYCFVHDLAFSDEYKGMDWTFSRLSAAAVIDRVRSL
jgi:hypothetical protein